MRHIIFLFNSNLSCGSQLSSSRGQSPPVAFNAHHHVPVPPLRIHLHQACPSNMQRTFPPGLLHLFFPPETLLPRCPWNCCFDPLSICSNITVSEALPEQASTLLPLPSPSHPVSFNQVYFSPECSHELKCVYVAVCLFMCPSL